MDRPAVAVIGCSGRFPGARTTEELWSNLVRGVESRREFTLEQVIAAGIDPDVAAMPSYVRASGALDDIELFDAGFFNVAPGEAELMDPQHRLFLECAWEALEAGGYDPSRFDGRVGVFSSASMSSYLLLNIRSHAGLLESLGYLPALIGTDKDYIPTRVSYKLNLRGPSINITSACSSSLVAVHLAVQSVLNGECDMALAGGVCVNTFRGYLFQEGTALSPDGHCRAFDADSHGTFPGSGVGIVLLKELEQAVKDRDTILGVILGTAVNNDGSLKVTYTAPSMQGQEAVVAEALAIAGIEARDLSYVEAHGTGTSLGDPIEVAALSNAFRYSTQDRGFCGIGSVKTNIGHLDAAAGVVSLIKVLLSLQHQQLPPTLHFQTPNPKLELAQSPFRVIDKLTPWEGPSPRRAGINSFGIGGTNAHVLVEEAPEVEPEPSRCKWHPLVLSARSAAALNAAAVRLADHLESHPDLDLADVAHTLLVGRQQFAHRRVVPADSVATAVTALRAAAEAEAMAASAVPVGEGSVAFFFPGQVGSLGAAAQELHGADSAYRTELDRIVRVAQPQLNVDLRSVLSAAPGSEQAVALAAPAAFAFGLALARLYLSWGIRPAALAGEGVGEHVAAVISGALDADEGLRLAIAHGKALQPGGSPAALVDRAAGLKLKAPEIPYATAATGAWATPAQLQQRQHWEQLLSSPVPRTRLLGVLASAQHRVVLEVGSEGGGWAHLARAFGNLWRQGVPVGAGPYSAESRRRVALPSYPFERSRYWMAPKLGR
jgi:acyl transferase domain-containing protein